MTQSETEIKKEILEGIKREFPDQVHVFRVWCGNMTAKHGARIIGAAKGTPDLCGFFQAGIKKGGFLGIEVKTPEGQFSKEQYEFNTRTSQAGATMIAAVSWQDCREKLEFWLREF